ncbi:transposase [Chakrabartyella piscis]|uniref:transposase n=1 Tax=Chakrabartyella piscis TaxID=2918914 RepID=UPI0029586987|nr:transposase [Chakrabartyella piscis]
MEVAKRKQTRLQEYDYSQNGAYFVTICTHEKQNLFGTISGGEMQYTPYGKIAYNEILQTQNKREQQGITIDKFVVMPNHVHLIISINVGSRLAVTAHYNQFSKPVSNSLQTIVGGYKSAVTRKIHQYEAETDMASHVPTVWQTRFHDHIIRNEASYLGIWQYIDNNVLSWEQDCYHTEYIQEGLP